MLLEQSLNKYPATPQLQEDCALPFGFTLQPFAKHAHVPLTSQPSLHVSNVPRCTDCGAYLNTFNAVDMIGFRCSLCGGYTEWTGNQSRRYGRPQVRDRQVELVRQVYEAVCPDYDDEVVRQGYQAMSGPFPAPKKGRPVFIALIDTAAGSDFLELVKLALAATLDALPANALVGIITVSDCIGLWDVKRRAAVVRRVPIFSTGEVMVLLEDALPLRALLAPLDTSSEQLMEALEALQPDRASEFGIGSALHAVMDYLAGLAIQPAVAPMRAAATSHSGEATTPLGPCKLTCFFATPPNTGLGATAGPADLSAPGHDRHAQVYPETVAAAQPPQQSAATNAFYEQLGSIAAGSGVCVDIFAIGRQPLGLAALTPLCRKSGGACFFYPSVEGSALPQDVVKRARTPLAMSALLRIRTCPEVRVVRAYGKLQPDPDHDQLWHAVAVDPHDTFSVSLELASVHGFTSRSGDRMPQPGLQVAFQYSLLTHRAPENDDEAAVAIGGEVYQLQRRLRVLTVAPSLAKSHDALYGGAQLEPAIAMLTQKVLMHALRDGPADARALLQDWLVIFLARWHHFARKLPFGEAPQPGRIDVRLSQAPGLASIPRVIYALLRCPLLATSTPVATDHAAALQTLWSSLGPDALLRAIHPMLVAFDDPESDKHSREPLSRDSLASGKGRVLLMDAFDVIVVLYRAAATSNLGAEALPFPPPAGSALRALVRRLVSARGIAPEVLYCREGDEAAQRLDAFLIDEPAVGAALDDAPASKAAKLGFASWLSHVETRVLHSLSGRD